MMHLHTYPRKQPNDQVHRAGAAAVEEQRTSVAPAPVQPLVRCRRGYVRQHRVSSHRAVAEISAISSTSLRLSPVIQTMMLPFRKVTDVALSRVCVARQPSSPISIRLTIHSSTTARLVAYLAI